MWAWNFLGCHKVCFTFCSELWNISFFHVYIYLVCGEAPWSQLPHTRNILTSLAILPHKYCNCISGKFDLQLNFFIVYVVRTLNNTRSYATVSIQAHTYSEALTYDEIKIWQTGMSLLSMLRRNFSYNAVKKYRLWWLSEGSTLY